MEPMSAFARTFVYPVVRAIADAWFDSMIRYNVSMEEIASELDKERAARFRAAVRDRVQSLTPSAGHPLQPNTAPGSGGDGRADLREIARRVLSSRDSETPQGLVDR